MIEFTSIPFFRINTFCHQQLIGNPAGVCLINEAINDQQMQDIATDLSLPATAFIDLIDKNADSLKENPVLGLRWFSPTTEIKLCGHATLASSAALLVAKLINPTQSLRFSTQAGEIEVCYQAPYVRLNMPLIAVDSIQSTPLLTRLFAGHQYLAQDQDYLMVVFASADEVLGYEPDFKQLNELPYRGVIITSEYAADEFDIVSRFFAPRMGVDEDSVTGSAHCRLMAYWSERLKCDELIAYQASKRGGVLRLKRNDQGVFISGETRVVVSGKLNI